MSMHADISNDVLRIWQTSKILQQMSPPHIFLVRIDLRSILGRVANKITFLQYNVNKIEL